MKSSYFNEEHEMFRRSLRDFLDKEVMPHIDAWEEAGEIPRWIWKKFGDQGYFGLDQKEEHGGSDVDFFYMVVFLEEISKCWSGGFAASLLCHPILTLSHIAEKGSDYLIENYLKPGIKGEKFGALAISEPGAGSDVANISTTAVKDGDHYIINGSKTFITNGVLSDYIVATCKTNPNAGSGGISLIIIDRNMKGVSATALRKLGWKASDTGEIHFDNVKVPITHVIGEENKGFYYIMQRFELERLVLAIGANAASEQAMEYTLQYMSERKAFGKPINKFQVLRHRMAQLTAELDVAQVYTYQICKMYNEGNYSVKEAAIAKLISTELADKLNYQCLQSFGGYGFMEEYKMARAFRDSRLGTIGGGTSEIMREIISKAVIDNFNFGMLKHL